MWGRKDFLVALYLKPRHDSWEGLFKFICEGHKSHLAWRHSKRTGAVWARAVWAGAVWAGACGPVAAVCSVLSPALTVTLDLGERGVKQACVEKQVQVGWSAKGWFCL